MESNAAFMSDNQWDLDGGQSTRLQRIRNRPVQAVKADQDIPVYAAFGLNRLP